MCDIAFLERTKFFSWFGEKNKNKKNPQPKSLPPSEADVPMRPESPYVWKFSKFKSSYKGP